MARNMRLGYFKKNPLPRRGAGAYRSNRKKYRDDRKWLRDYVAADKAVKKVTGKRIHEHAAEQGIKYIKASHKRIKPVTNTYEEIQKIRDTKYDERAKTARRTKPRLPKGSITETSPPGKAKLNRYTKPVGAGSSISSFSIYKRPPGFFFKIYKNLSPFQIYQINNSVRMSSNDSAQGIYHFPVLQRTDLADLSKFITGVDPSTASAIPTRFIIPRVTIRHTMTNMTNITAFLEIYECICRLESNTNAAQAFVNGFGQEYNTQTATLSTNTIISNGAYNIGATPFQSEFFCRRWLIQKVEHIELAPGRSHQHISRYQINRYFNTADLDTTTDCANQKGLTRTVFFRLYGSPVNKIDKTLVTVGGVAIDLQSTTKYEYRYINPEPMTYILKDVLPTTAQIGTPETMSEEGVPQTETSA